MLLSSDEPLSFPRCPKRLGFYPVVPDADWVEKLLLLGVRTIQIRVKTLSGAALRQELARAVRLGNDFGARVFINDHWQLAIELAAYGVHLGQEDIQGANLAAISRAGLRLGISTHGYFELLRAEALEPSYVALGAIFPTTTKVMPTAPQGLDKLAHYCRLLPHRPKVAIGGINMDNASSVLACGPDSLAVVRAVTESEDLDACVGYFLKLCGAGG
ncbi:thiamine phosphate synthase [Gallaecimonas sp. GXIMD4217]|uniref:thiamine phosphate synthase n=1 Tax=Gallaecimonas sp. GXIMD4217 TaxID=3131927 RepID=UPI00311B249B